MSLGARSRNGYWCVLDLMVVRTFSGSVVAKMNTRCSGGSSTILSSALKPSLVIMWASSMMNTRYRDSAGA